MASYDKRMLMSMNQSMGTNITLLLTNCQLHGVNLVTNFTLSNDKGSEYLMMGTSALMTIFGCLLCVCGLFAQFFGQKKHPLIVRVFLRATFAIFLPLMSSMFSQANTTGNTARADLILLWMLLVELLHKKVYALVVSDSNSPSMGFGSHATMDAVEQAARMVWIGYLIYAYVHGFGPKSLFIILWICSVVKIIKRAAAIQLAKRSFALANNAHLVAGYMAQMIEEEKHCQQQAEAEPLKTCNYLIMGEDELKRVHHSRGFHIDLSSKPQALVTVEKIWQLVDEDQLFRTRGQMDVAVHEDNNAQMAKDLCLSYALFKLLRRRFENFPIAEAGTREARELVLKGLLHLDGASDEENAERALKVVDMELSFLEEYYMGVIPVAVSNPWLFVANSTFSIFFVFAYIIAVLVITGNGDIFHVIRSIVHGLVNVSTGMVGQFKCLAQHLEFLAVMIFSSFDLIITFLLMFTFAAIEIWEFGQYMLSDWLIVSLLSDYARKPSWRKKRAFRWGIKLALHFRYWQRSDIKIDQVSILRLRPRGPRRLLTKLLKLRLAGLPPVSLSKEAKTTIVSSLKCSLKRCLDDPTHWWSNGTFSLSRNHCQDLMWACESNSATEVILLWHLATGLFELQLDDEKKPKGWNPSPERKVATQLSNYCAYLVAYVPELLPDDQDFTESSYEKMREEVQQDAVSQCFGNPSWRCKRMRDLAGQETMAQKGAALCIQLEEMMNDIGGEEVVWKVLAELWGELLIYVAPSNNVKGHAKALAEGGEFITFLWAILTHAGIVHRPDDPPVECRPLV